MTLSNSKFILYVAMFFLAFDKPCYSSDTSKYEETCIDIGFKKKTEAFSNCILELIERDKPKGIEQVPKIKPNEELSTMTQCRFIIQGTLFSDCPTGYSCRSKAGGGSECRDETNRIAAPIQAPTNAHVSSNVVTTNEPNSSLPTGLIYPRHQNLRF